MCLTAVQNPLFRFGASSFIHSFINSFILSLGVQLSYTGVSYHRPTIFHLIHCPNGDFILSVYMGSIEGGKH